ncbi:P-loop containing nucleoside triphosphate hydrolase protein, partial [Fistulina hepatica ATCC 64428]
IFGLFFEVVKPFIVFSWNCLTSYFFVTAIFDKDDPAYDWMVYWFTRQKQWDVDRCVEIKVRDDVITRYPSYFFNYVVWYKGRRVSMRRVKKDLMNGDAKGWLELNIFARDRTFLTQLITDAQSSYRESRQGQVQFYTPSPYGSWKDGGRLSMRSSRSVVLDPGIKERLFEDVQTYLRSRDWYTERGVPYRRGYLFYGVPGSGKSSLIYSIASELELDVFLIPLGAPAMSDGSLDELIRALPQRCIAVMEDIDVSYDSSKSGHTGFCSVSLSAVLNSIDGVGSQEGRILLATTNNYATLNPALCRAGRFDVHLEFKMASKYQARELFLLRMPLVEAKGLLSSELSPLIGSLDVQLEASSPEWMSNDAECLAKQFASAIPERMFSMAALQGYLLQHIGSPHVAAHGVGEWVDEQLQSK